MTISTRTLSAFGTATDNVRPLVATENPSKTSRLTAFVKAETRSRKRRTPFATIVWSFRSSNIQRLKDRAFLANRLAKIALGASRHRFYRLKDDAVNALLHHGAATLNSVDCLSDEPIIGLAFTGGGQLHIPLARLDPLARRRVQQQFHVALSGRDSVDTPPNKASEDFGGAAQGGRS